MMTPKYAEELWQRTHGQKPWYQRTYIYTRDTLVLVLALVFLLMYLAVDEVAKRFKRK
jgi:hypothetical protein